MPVCRERVTKNFTPIPNRALRDPRLKGEEKGLLAWLLTHDPHWKIVIPVIMREMGWGRDKAYRVLKRLCEFGYIQRAQERDPGSGAFGEVSYTVYSNPNSNSAYAAAIVEQPLPDSPLPEKPKASKE
jgi:Helix-turn-helix domain